MRHAALAVALIACSSPSSSSTAPPAGSGSGSASPARFAGLIESVDRGDAPDTTSVLVMRHGAIEFEHHWQSTADKLNDTRSATKTITALAVGAALDAKLIPNLDAPAFPYLADVTPANMSPAKQAITIGDLVTMSSALDCDDNDDKSPGNEENMYPKDVWLRWAADLPARTDYKRDASGRGPWHYCTAGTFLLGQIVQRAAKQPIDEFIIDKIFKPLGITAFEFARSPTKEVMTGGGLRLTSRDLAKLGWLIRSNGAGIISADFVRAMQTAHTHTPNPPDDDYGYLMWGRMFKTPCGSTRAWRMSGNGGNTVAVLADLDAVVVVTRTHYNAKGMHQETAKLIEEHVIPEISCGK